MWKQLELPGTENKVIYDRTGKKCESCGKGRYAETTYWDDVDGYLHCKKCDHLVNRYVKSGDKDSAKYKNKRK